MSNTSLESCEAFSRSVEIYDLIHANKDYDGEAARVLELIGSNPQEPEDWLFDWGCGTGEFTRRFAAAGWNALGSDCSHHMVSAAVRKGVNAHFGDMREEPIVDGAAAQTCLFAAFSYASASYPPLLILENFRKAAAPGGKLVFDFVNADAEIYAEQSRLIPSEPLTVSVCQSKRMVDSRLIENRVSYWTVKTAGGDAEQWVEMHYLRTFTAREMAELLSRSGWSLQRLVDNEAGGQAALRSSYYITASCIAV